MSDIEFLNKIIEDLIDLKGQIELTDADGDVLAEWSEAMEHLHRFGILLENRK